MGGGIDACSLICISAVLLTFSMLIQSGAAADPTTPISAICGGCCSQGTFCTATTGSTTLSQSAGDLPGGEALPSCRSRIACVILQSLRYMFIYMPDTLTASHC